jgi:hypothetical protein
MGNERNGGAVDSWDQRAAVLLAALDVDEPDT